MRRTPFDHPGLFAVLIALVVSGCTTLGDVAPGTPLAEVEERYGHPSYICPQADADANANATNDGTQRLIWSRQPNGQAAWAVTVTPDGRIRTIEAVLTDAAFQRLHAGMTVEQLRCTFGPPAIIATLGRGETRRTIWSYRYREAGVWNSLMHVYLDDHNQVERFHSGPDPMFEEDRRFGGLFGGLFF